MSFFLRRVVGGIIDAIRSKPVTEIPGAVANAAACIKTDMETGELIELVRNMSGNLTMYSGTLPYDGDLDGWADPDHNLYYAPWLCYVNEAGTARVLEVIDSGGDPSTVSYKGDSVHFAGQPRDTWSQGPQQPDDVIGR